MEEEGAMARREMSKVVTERLLLMDRRTDRQTETQTDKGREGRMEKEELMLCLLCSLCSAASARGFFLAWRAVLVMLIGCRRRAGSS